MSKLSKIINILCKKELPYFSLGELEDSGRIILGRGMVISKFEMASNPGPYPVYSSSSTNNGMIGTYGKYMFNDERLTWSIDGGGRFFYRNNEKYSVTNVGGWLKVLDDKNISTRYLFHVLSSEWNKKTFDYTHKAHPSVIRDEYIIPVPPMEVQCEIVRILDSFTELTARKKQYDYYRHYLLQLNGIQGVEEKNILDVSPISRGKRVTKNQINGGSKFPVYQNSLAPMGFYDSYNYEKDKTYVISAGAAGEIGFCDECFWAADDCLVIETNDPVLNKYIYYWLIDNQERVKSMVRKASIPRLSRDVVEKMKIKIPPRKEQIRINCILDKFVKLISDFSQGIPAEIKGRIKQYEYYREQLLSFKEQSL